MEEIISRKKNLLGDVTEENKERWINRQENEIKKKGEK